MNTVILLLRIKCTPSFTKTLFQGVHISIAVLPSTHSFTLPLDQRHMGHIFVSIYNTLRLLYLKKNKV